MRVVERVPFAEYFKTSGDLFDEFEPTTFYEFFYRRSRYFNKLSFTLFLLASTAFTSLFAREARVAFLVLAGLLVILFFVARRAAEGFHITRRLSPRVIERTELSVEYEIRNASGFTVSDFLISDVFTGSVQGHVELPMMEDVPPYYLRRLSHRFRCDGGMGTHRFGPLSVIVTDPLGVFRFRVRDEELQLVEVLPEYLALGDFVAPASLESTSIGQNESPMQGQSVTFHGVREYRIGDPLNRINWRLSARHRELIVNEFESSINTDLTILFDLESRNQIGKRANSSWEYLKDILVSLLHERMSGVSRVQLISQDLMIPFGSGTDHLHWMIDKVSKLGPAQPASRLSRKRMDAIPYGSSVLYVGAIFQNDPGELASWIESLQRRAITVSAILVDARGFSSGIEADPMVLGQVAGLSKVAERVLRQVLENHTRLGVRTFVVEPQPSAARAISQAMIRPRTS